MKKLFIFDVDDVLTEDISLRKARFNELIKNIAKKFKVDKEKARKMYLKSKNSLDETKKYTSIYIFTNLGFTRKDFFKALDNVNPKGKINSNKRIRKVVEKLSKKYKIITFSNSPRKTSIKTINLLKINKYIHKTYSAEDFKESKPSINILKKILDDTKLNPKDTVVVGDSLEKDVIPAHKLGITTILFDPDNRYKRKPKEVNYILNNIENILKLF